MTFETSPANVVVQEMQRRGRRIAFADIGLGQTFECNGNLWAKRSSRTAAGIWPAVLPSWAYFGKSVTCHLRPSITD